MVEKILFTPHRGIGDLIHSLPLIHSLRSVYPKHKIIIPIVDSQQKIASKDLKPLVGKYVLFSNKSLNNEIDSERKLLYRGVDFLNKYKVDFEKRNNFENKLYNFYLKGEEYSIAVTPRFFKIDTIKAEKQYTLNDLKEIRGIHMVDRYLKFAEVLGIPKKISFELGVDWKKRIENYKKEKVKLPDNYILLLLSAGRETKRWTSLGFKSVVKYCKNKRIDPVLIGSKEDYTFSKEIASEEILNLTSPKFNLINLENFARMAKNSLAVVGSDTGLTHIADASGAKVVGLYGPTRPSKFAPYNNKRFVVSSNGSSKKMKDLNPNEVLGNLEKILDLI